jgi:hypothetical protein
MDPTEKGTSQPEEKITFVVLDTLPDPKEQEAMKKVITDAIIQAKGKFDDPEIEKSMADFPSDEELGIFLSKLLGISCLKIQEYVENHIPNDLRGPKEPFNICVTRCGIVNLLEGAYKKIVTLLYTPMPGATDRTKIDTEVDLQGAYIMVSVFFNAKGESPKFFGTEISGYNEPDLPTKQKALINQSNLIDAKSNCEVLKDCVINTITLNEEKGIVKASFLQVLSQELKSVCPGTSNIISPSLFSVLRQTKQKDDNKEEKPVEESGESHYVHINYYSPTFGERLDLLVFMP